MRFHRPLILTPALAAAVCGAAGAQTFSIDNHGPLISVPDAFTGTAITEADILTPALPGAPGPNVATLGAPAPPGIFRTGGFGVPGPGLGLGLHAACVGHAPGTPCPVEVDALSYGFDTPLQPNFPTPPATYYFSVDEFASGFPTPAGPNVASEGFAGPQFEAAGDVFTDLGVPIPGPYAPFAFPPGNTGVIDGNGAPNGAGVAYPGLGLIEPNLPSPPPDSGDNVDAVDVDTTQVGAIYFSLDAAFIDPLTGAPLTGAAAAHGFVGGDVIVTANPAPAPALYAPAFLLGLDIAGGPDSDDLDALALWDNGNTTFQPSQQPYDWAGGARDMLLFSVRRGSAVIGMPDSIFGIPIQAGDILTTPLPTALGGVSPFPGIFMAAENLGLATAAPRLGIVPFGDDLDALDIARQAILDCNMNGVEDAVDIATGTSLDANTNGVPDECETPGSAYCFCPAASAICGNADPSAGCRNSGGTGALLTGSGTNSVGTDNLVLTVTGAPTNVFGIFFFGPNAIDAPFGDGRRCVGGSLRRFLPIQNSGAAGTFTLGPGIVAYTLANFSPSHQIAAFQTWRFQSWFRDSMGPCGNGFNLSNGYSVSFVP